MASTSACRPTSPSEWARKPLVCGTRTPQSIKWSPSGKDLLVLEGGDLFLLHTDTGDWSQLTATSEAERDPKLSPDGARVAAYARHRKREAGLATLKA